MAPLSLPLSHPRNQGINKLKTEDLPFLERYFYNKLKGFSAIFGIFKTINIL